MVGRKPFRYLLNFPYDGFEIGEFIGDAGRGFSGTLFDMLSVNASPATGCFSSTPRTLKFTAGSAGFSYIVYIVAPYPTAPEFRPGSISVSAFITY